ncbi:hypothetical protein AC1031_003843 [Aphanomyces cochlioides]|nr:hypothetical protein AC1031_003843 [Aphanomyces cochlioides]
MTVSWSTLCASLEPIMKRRGFDLIIPMSVGMYNEVAPDEYKLASPSTSLLAMIGNTKHLWPYFVDSIDVDNIPDHPLDEFTIREVTHGLNELETELDVSPDQVYWVHDTAKGKMIAAIRMVVASGFASFSNEAHLSVHPTYGPWFGLRAAVVFPCDGPTERVFHEPSILELPPDVSKRTEELYNKALSMPSVVSAEAKSIWFQLRTGIAPAHPFMYTDAQIRFHYASSAAVRAAILRAVQNKQPVDYVLDPPSDSIVSCRRLLQTVLAEIAEQQPDAVLLSGGLDTSIITEATGSTLEELQLDKPPLIHVKGGITVRAHPEAKDALFAKAICDRVGIIHHCLEVSIEELLEHAPAVVRLLRTFDPMELRNSIVIYHSLLHAHKQGYKRVITGDGADELFAGYSFYHFMPQERLQTYREHIARIMRFSAPQLAAALGIEVFSPFLDERVVAFALALEKDALVGEKTPVPNSKVYGKLILRRAFPEAFSQWRDKEPIEQGSGTTQLRMGYFDAYNSEFAHKQHDYYVRHDVVLRDAEHVFFFERFLESYKTMADVPIPRYTDEACPACHFELSSKEQDFCVTCGFWPARTTEANAASATRALEQLAAQIETIKQFPATENDIVPSKVREAR